MCSNAISTPSSVQAVARKLGRQRRRLDDQRMISADGQRRRQAGEQSPCHHAESCDVRPCTGRLPARFDRPALRQSPDAPGRRPASASRRAAPARCRATHPPRAACTARAKARSRRAHRAHGGDVDRVVAHNMRLLAQAARSSGPGCGRSCRSCRSAESWIIVVGAASRAAHRAVCQPGLADLRPQCPQHPGRLVPGFFVFVSRIRLGDDAAADRQLPPAAGRP